jgi:hypothetical protein
MNKSIYNMVTKEEADDLRFILDDADMLHSTGRRGLEDRMLKLWRRLHLWLLSEQGDRDALMILQREFPGFIATVTVQGDPRRLRCDKCGDTSVLYGPVGHGEQHEGCGGFYRLWKTA